ncbi:phosphoglycerate mutase family protein [Lacinutrix neustonica]|uniref:Phosphoglycerate mutase family protein n=1 Tax=Lacinutrix neustonica TaxID=2980107 RepID=A0A9E8SGV1_9FLAO|nr:phosphoglycerate mutase family protein [Lacinutrix neustonica]WAC02090.1 phosphoglycerate mutase family protein [Lacinutrix neustonica]
MRHAEKDLSRGNNPKLTKQGHQRAKRLANYFKNKPLSAVYSTNFHRTLNTAKPAANAKGLKPIIYSPTKFDYDAFLKDTKGTAVLIVGHSNTIPDFVNKIIGENKYKEIDERIYSNLYIVTIKNNVIEDELISQD